MIVLKLSNPNDFVKSASISHNNGEYYFLNVTTKYGKKNAASRSLHSLKVLFGVHLMTGAKWEKIVQQID